MSTKQPQDTLAILSIVIPVLFAGLSFSVSIDFSELEKLEIWLLYGGMFVLVLIPIYVFYLNKKKQRQIDDEKNAKIENLEQDKTKQALIIEEKKKKINQLQRQINERKIKFADNIPEIVGSISSFLNNKPKKDSKDSIIEDIDVLLNSMAVIYSKLKNAKCCFTAKIIRSDAEEIFTLSRSKGQEFSKREKRESYIGSNKFDLFIEGNSDLKAIYGSQSHEKELKYLVFFDNDLVIREGFKHSGLNNYQDKINELEEEKRKLQKYEKWPLPYRSTIVVPLGLMSKKTDGNGVIKHESDVKPYERVIYGTLCVDCEKPNVFDKKLDTAILQSLAELIYLRLRAYESKGGENYLDK